MWVEANTLVMFTEAAEHNNPRKRARVYPATTRDGTPIPNAVVICFEEASNNDHQDTVLLVTNVTPAP
jgi:hypothetical protein